VPLAAIRAARDAPVPAADARTIKAQLRCGMGPCQGAMCAEAVAAAVGADPDAPGPVRARPPVAPVSVGALAAPPLT
jgi:hypothetical protein